MNIIKRDGRKELYDSGKITAAIAKAFLSTGEAATGNDLAQITGLVEQKLNLLPAPVQVETIQDLVEESLMELGFYRQSKSYILYRDQRARLREVRSRIAANLEDMPELDACLLQAQKDFPEDAYALEKLNEKFSSFLKPQLELDERLSLLTQAAMELTTQEAPKWEMIAARLLMLEFNHGLKPWLSSRGINSLYEKITYLTDEGLYGKYILEHYSPEEIAQAQGFIEPERDKLFTYSGLELLLQRYVIINHEGRALETPQEMFLGIALHLAMKESQDKMDWVKSFYDMLSSLKVTMATPTLSNARKPFHQLSSCFIDTVPDSLIGIYRSIDNFAQVSKYGGGMGMYFGKVRAKGSSIRGFSGAAGGVVRWIRLANDTAVAVDQLGMRQGAVAVYLDAWHKDLPEFLALRTNNGDDRMKAHDVFPAICFPDLFWKLAREDLDAPWYLMCPHEVLKKKGYAIEDSYGELWEQRYKDCVADDNISKRVVTVKEIVRMLIKSAVETGTPFIFNRDAVNRMNPNSHEGIIYCSNLCTEIAQNMSAIQDVSQEITQVNGETVVVTTTKPGDFVVCNLASLNLGRIDVNKPGEIREMTRSAIRALDNVIDLNFFPLPYAKVTNMRYRPLGLGVSGYHHMLAKNAIAWESEGHLDFVDKVFEEINYSAIEMSCEIAGEKGAYEFFEGSQWHTGEYFSRRGYADARWQSLAERVAETGLRNGWLLAVAPTSSTSILSGTTAGIDPLMNRYYLEEKKNGLMPRVAPDLSQQTYWYYQNAHQIDQSWSVRAAGVRQRHIDQAQSMNLYITNNYSFRQILALYILAFEQGVKTLYYIRSKSLEVEDCEACSS